MKIKIFNFLENNENKIYYFVMALILLPIIIIGFYAHPSFDDFAYSVKTYHVVNDGGGLIAILLAAFQTSIEFMYTWQGLYSSAFLLALQPAIFGEQFYFLTVFVILAILFLGVYLFYRSLSNNILKLEKGKTLLLSFITVFFLVETVPNPYESLYWFNGAVNYIFFFGLLLIILSMYINILFKEKVNPFYIGFLTILTFALSGGNHVTAFAGLFLEFIILIYVFIKRKKYYLVIPFIAALVGFIINLLAPGTRVRADALEFNGDVFRTLKTTFDKSFGLFSEWISVALILFLILVIVILYKDLKKLKISYNKKYIFIPIISYLLLAGMMCVPFYALGGFGAGRVLDTFYYTFVIVILLNMVILIKFLMDKKFLNLKTLNFKSKFFLSLFVLLFIGYFGNSFWYNSTTYEAVKELTSSEAQKFDYESNERVKKYTDKEIDKVIVSPFVNKPYLLYGTDVCEITDSNKCTNNGINYYYDKKVIGIKK